MYVLGLNAYHGDSAAAIVGDGHVLAAAEEERFTRVKHWAGVPVNAIDFCLSFAGINFDQLSCVAVNMDNDAHRGKKFIYLFKSRPGIGLILEKLKTRSSRESLMDSISRLSSHNTDGIPLQAVEHHHAHLASAFYPSGFDSAALLSVDGFGDFSSAAMGAGSSCGIDIFKYVHFPHSLGVFYQAITQYLGFPNYGDEYKVMGLASYGEPEFVRQLSTVLKIEDSGIYRLGLDYFTHQNQSVYSRSESGVPEFANLYSKQLEKLLGPARQQNQSVDQRHKNIAATTQYLYEQALFALLDRLHQQTGDTNLAMAGGCAMNSVANGKIKSNTAFENIYVQPAGGDAGGAIGSALIAWRQYGQDFPKSVMPDAYLGPEYSINEIRTLVHATVELRTEEFCIDECGDAALFDTVCDGLMDGAVVGWFQGRMEWGPRALGNRSILADPRRMDIQDLLNRKIKRRETFRPFAPSILAEEADQWFTVNDKAPFMEKVYPVRKEKVNLIPAVTHVDGTGRLQTVEKSFNSRYHGLINRFFEKTGVPILLNTSFNENEPIVCHPQQALDCFLRTRMDILVMGNLIVRRIN